MRGEVPWWTGDASPYGPLMPRSVGSSQRTVGDPMKRDPVKSQFGLLAIAALILVACVDDDDTDGDTDGTTQIAYSAPRTGKG